ncbi:hypothetical protein KEM52_001348 [Ascosphaera acerosa]|nr:hypothetical protein KEM52_001348 [Ascosphaera acerosa]
MATTTIYAANVHCDACAAHVDSVLSSLPHIDSAEVDVFRGKIVVRHAKSLPAHKIVGALQHADFSITESYPLDDSDGHANACANVDASDEKTAGPNPSSTSPTLSGRYWQHLDYCAVCQAEYHEKGWSQPPKAYDVDIEAQQDSVNGDHDEEIKEYRAEISVGGMTCASCAQSVTAAIKELSIVKEAAVTLLTNSSSVVFSGRRSNVDKIIEAIEDAGFDAELHAVEVIPPAHPGAAPAAAAGAAVAQHAPTPDAPKQRTLSLQVDGMFCPECPNAVLDAVRALSSDSITVLTAPTLKKPVLAIQYTPRVPDLTVRTLITAISSRRPGFRASVFHPPTLEDRSRAVQRREEKRLGIRLLFSLAVSIVVFVIMIVIGTLLPRSNHLRQKFMTPIWNGNATREEWALFITSTPLMFYGADVFHRSAFMEIKHLWRRGSPVPLYRRFLRFGSMNLLVSAGTCVAYFASLAMLIIHARQQPDPIGSRHSESYFDTVAFLTMFILCGRSLEAYSKAKTGDAVDNLGKLRPSEALLVGPATSGGGQSEITKIPTDHLEVGDTVCIPSGGSPPADGILQAPLDATAHQFDESSLTGESRPAEKVAGDKVFAGSVNIDDRTAKMVVTDIGGTSLLDQIVNVVREGQTKKAPVERVADVITAYFVPVVTYLAILVFLIWLALGVSGTLPKSYIGTDAHEGGWGFWALKFAIAVFVVACPCGLALAAPTALFVGIGIAAKTGILVRGGGEAFQEATRLDAVVFDKTGTLTEGNAMAVSACDVLIDDGSNPDAHGIAIADIAWALAASLEETSSHPKARAILAFCKQEHPSRLQVDNAEVIVVPGKGVRGTFHLRSSDPSSEEAQYEASLGSRNLLDDVVGTSPDAALGQRLNAALLHHEADGTTTAVLYMRRLSTQPAPPMPALLFAFSDPIRPEARRVLDSLHARNVDVFMCTGDNISTAKGVARQLGIPPSHIAANVDPVAKAAFTEAVQRGEYIPDVMQAVSAQTVHERNDVGLQQARKGRRVVAFVGDGTNDSGALAVADVGIAMSSGSDVALSAASFILLNCELTSVLDLIAISKRVINRVRYNFAWAAVYNVCLIPVAAGVFYPIVSGKQIVDGASMDKHWRLDPAWASLAMALSSVSVVCSSLALRVEVRSWLREVLWWKR